jgi:hypothetical protein
MEVVQKMVDRVFEKLLSGDDSEGAPRRGFEPLTFGL